ncbi:MAG: hypothetical protein JOZ36_12125 [Acidobacteria bacterium]|nr:hypothetical protein [Acidobacteriota bacterium]
MLDFVCDTCSAVKEPGETWIVGLAAEALGAVSARREVNIQSTWTREAAVHPLAVHFCSIECKDDYMTRLFGDEAGKQITAGHTVRSEAVVQEKDPERRGTKTRRVQRHRRAS